MNYSLFLKEKGGFLIVGMLLLFFITDALNVILVYYDFSINNILFTAHTKLSSLSKGAFFFIVCSILLFQKQYLYNSITTLILLAFFALIGIDFCDNIYISTWFLHISKLFFPIVLFIFTSRILQFKSKLVFVIYRILIVVQAIVVILSYFEGWDIFLTYGKNRFGYSGLLYAQNEATFFYIIAFVFLLNEWMNCRRKYDLILLFLILIASLLLGTKAIFIFYISLVLIFIYINKSYNRAGLLLVSFFVVSAVCYGLFLSGIFDFYIDFGKEKGWLTMVTSLRSQLVIERLPQVFEHWHWYNWLLGGVNPATSFVEMDLIDLFTFGGIVGFVLYFIILFKTLFSFSKSNVWGWFLVSQYLIIGGLAGHVLASGINAIYLVIVCYGLQKNNCPDCD